MSAFRGGAATAMMCLAFLACGQTGAAQSFRGPSAVRELREHAVFMRSPFVALWLVPRPGAEDFEAIASLRLLGGQPVIVYATNGESAPTHSETGPLLLAAAVRKEEADAAATALGGMAWFLNLPDAPGDWNLRLVAGDSLWNAAVDSLAVAIRTARPGVVIVGRDRTTGVGSATEMRALSRLAALASEVASDARRTLHGPLPLASRWNVPVSYVDASDGPAMAAVPSSVKAGVARRARESRDAYSSLRGLLERSGPARYVRSAAGNRRDRTPLGAPAAIPPLFATLAAEVRAASAAVVSGSPKASAAVDRSQAELSRFLQPKLLLRLSAEDKRRLAQWKMELDLVKTLLVQAPIRVTVSDSVMTDRQLFTVTVDGADSLTLPGRSGIIFHLPRGEEWIINISMNRQFDLQKTNEFRIITPVLSPKSYPVAESGWVASVLRIPLRFSIFHEARKPERSFITTFEPRIGFAPKWGTIIRTPVVCTDPADPVVVEVHNYSRDGGAPSFVVRDLLCGGSSPPADMPGKGSVAIDTLDLRWDVPDDSLHGDHRFLLRSGKAVVGTIVGRPMRLSGDSTLRVGIVGPEGGIVERALRRVRGPQVVGSDLAAGPRLLDSSAVLVVDGDAGSTRDEDAIMQWVRRGGQAIVLCESPGTWSWPSVHDSVWLDATEPSSVLAGIVEPGGPLVPGWTPLGTANWDGWPTYRSRAIIRWTGGLRVDPLVTMADGGAEVVTWKEGHGRVTVVALTMRAALRELHTGAHRLLANLLSLKP